MTPRQAELLRFIAGYVTANGMAPTYGEMCSAMGWATKSVAFRMVEQLEDAGCLVKQTSSIKTAHRGIELTPRGVVAAGGSPLSHVATADLEAELARRLVA